MYKRNNMKIIICSFIGLGAILLISLIYAAFTGQLNISGTTTARKSKWDIHFENLSNITTTGSGKILTQPELDGTTTIEDYDATVTSPGDTISFTFKVVNDGNYNASISSVSVGTPECSGTDSTSNSNVCSNLTYTLTYDSGATVQTGDTLYAKDYVTMKVMLTYQDFNDASLLPIEDVSISNLGITINYTQSGSAEVGDNGVVQNNKVYHQGDKITLKNEDYYVIANSGAGQDYVVVLKDLPLTVAEVNLYGGVGTDNNHVNNYTQSSIGTSKNEHGFGSLAYYSRETCGYINGSWITTGCKTDYSESDIKYVVDAWALAKFVSNELKTVDNYNARLITREEYQSIANSYVWRANSNCWYWTMTASTNNNVWYVNWDAKMSLFNVSGSGLPAVVRPVINVYKSSIDTNN